MARVCFFTVLYGISVARLTACQLSPCVEGGAQLLPVTIAELRPDGAVWDLCGPAHGVPAPAAVERCRQLLAAAIAEFGEP
jgi:hypothetical protein